MTEHEQYHQIMVDLLSEIALITGGMLSVFIVASAILIWMVFKK